MFVLDLRRKRGLVWFASRSFLGRSGVGSDSTLAAVEGDVGLVVHDHGTVDVNISDVDSIDMHHGGVVEEPAVAPFSSEEADASVTEAIVNATVKTDVRTPITTMPGVKAAAPSPVARSPKHSDGRHHPGAGHPVVASIIVPCPVAGRPQVAGAGTDRLRVNRQRRRTNANRDAHPDLSRRRSRKNRWNNQQ